jgi:hypothetical protein
VDSNTPDLVVPLGIGTALGLVLLTAIYISAVRTARRSTSSWVVSRLSGPEDRVTVRVSTLEHVWNPAKPLGLDNGLFGPGEGTYAREVRPDGDLIHLFFLRDHESTAEHHAGPIPASAISGTAANRRARGVQRTSRAMMVAQLVILVVTVGLAFVVGSAGAATAIVAAGVILALFGPPIALWIWMRRRSPDNADEREAPSRSTP